MKVDNQANGERVHVSMRGQGILTERGVRGIKVLLDGLPGNDPSGFAPDLFDVDWATVAPHRRGARPGVVSLRRRLERAASSSIGRATAGRRAGGGAVRHGRLVRVLQAARARSTARRDGSSYARLGLARPRATATATTRRSGATTSTASSAVKVGNEGRLTAIVAGTSFFNENAEGLNLDWLAQDRRMANPDAIKYNEYQRTGAATVGLTGR